LTSLEGGANPSTLERKRARTRQIGEPERALGIEMLTERALGIQNESALGIQTERALGFQRESARYD